MPVKNVSALLSAVAACYCAAAYASGWPPLPSVGFIKGRAAGRADVAAGVAAFSLELPDGHSAGVPITLQIPQYAIWHDQKTHADVPVIIIQAEMRGALHIIGFKRVKGGGLGVAPQAEFSMLGTDRTKLPGI
jgi:hypothetical protein